MKVLKNTVMAMAMAMTASLASADAYAEQKIGFVNIQMVFEGIPQAAVIQQEIIAEFKDQMEVVQRLEKDLQYYLERQTRASATMSEEEMAELEQQVINLRDEYTAKAQPLQQNIQRRQAEERNRFQAMILEGINKVAKAENYDFVFTSTSVTFAKEQHDISQKVLDEIRN